MSHGTGEAMRYRSGYYDARDGRGFQKCTSTLSQRGSWDRDQQLLEDQERRRWRDDIVMADISLGAITGWLRSLAGQEHLKRTIPGYGE
jgi:hypothetical protein